MSNYTEKTPPDIIMYLYIFYLMIVCGIGAVVVGGYLFIAGIPIPITPKNPMSFMNPTTSLEMIIRGVIIGALGVVLLRKTIKYNRRLNF